MVVFVSLCGLLVLQLSSKLLEIRVSTLLFLLSLQCVAKERSPVARELPVAVPMELASLTLICFPSGKAPVYLRLPQKFHPECTK